jgi:hypothetical protein
MKHIYLILAFVFLLVSCGKEPTACFTIGTNTDSLFTNRPILFDASCSKDATQFKWTFSDKPDSVYYSKMFYRTFSAVDTKLVVKLTAILGGRQSVKQQTVQIK